jgi:hypothetical protein
VLIVVSVFAQGEGKQDQHTNHDRTTTTRVGGGSLNCRISQTKKPTTKTTAPA